MLYDSLPINNCSLGGENRFGETTIIVGETLVGFAGKVASRLSDAAVEFRGINNRGIKNVLFASWLMFAPVIAPISVKAANINNNAKTTIVGLQPVSYTHLHICSADGESICLIRF